jgi:hypothetical protein
VLLLTLAIAEEEDRASKQTFGTTKRWVMSSGKKKRNIYYNNIGGSEGSNKTSKFLANKISDK